MYRLILVRKRNLIHRLDRGLSKNKRSAVSVLLMPLSCGYLQHVTSNDNFFVMKVQ